MDLKALKQQIDIIEAYINELEQYRDDDTLCKIMFGNSPSFCKDCSIMTELPGPYCRCPKIQTWISRCGGLTSQLNKLKKEVCHEIQS